jgi:hypothetical protein
MESHGKQTEGPVPGTRRMPFGLTERRVPQAFQYGSGIQPIHQPSDPWLVSIDKLLPRGDGRYWYLAGPMSGKPGYNYPEFERIAGILRNQAYPIVSPHEFEHESHRKRIAEADGHEDVGAPWQDCLARDVAVVANPRCIGVILIDDWHTSKGALLETQVASSLGKQLFEFSENPLQLRQIDREEALKDYEKAAMLTLFEVGIQSVEKQRGPLPGGVLNLPKLPSVDERFPGERLK